MDAGKKTKLESQGLAKDKQEQEQDGVRDVEVIGGICFCFRGMIWWKSWVVACIEPGLCGFGVGGGGIEPLLICFPAFTGEAAYLI